MKRSITDIPTSELTHKRVLVREDLNVPMNEDGSIASDFRIREALPTLEYLLKNQAKVILATHMGRPKGKPDDAFRLKPIAERLQSLLGGIKVHYVTSIVGPEVDAALATMQAGELLILENIRFEAGETENNPEFAQKLASYADIYVNDAFGTSHRAHASTEGVAHYVPVKVAGLLMQKELLAMSQIVEHPKHPFTAIIGGSKVSTKINVLNNLLPKVDTLVIGGGMIFTFLKAQGLSVGNSLVEIEYLETAKALLNQALSLGKTILIASDIVIADKFDKDANHQTVAANQILDGWMGLDIGPESQKALVETIKNSKTVFWNGPLGVFEFPAFAAGTEIVAKTLVDATQNNGLITVLGGGDTQAAIKQFGYLSKDFTHVSTGGGASMEFIEGKVLPGIAVLDEKIAVSI